MGKHFEPFEDKAGLWRWRFIAGNGQIPAVSGESFDSESNAFRAARRMSAQMIGHPPVVRAKSS